MIVPRGDTRLSDAPDAEGQWAVRRLSTVTSSPTPLPRCITKLVETSAQVSPGKSSRGRKRVQSGAIRRTPRPSRRTHRTRDDDGPASVLPVDHAFADGGDDPGTFASSVTKPSNRSAPRRNRAEVGQSSRSGLHAARRGLRSRRNARSSVRRSRARPPSRIQRQASRPVRAARPGLRVNAATAKNPEAMRWLAARAEGKGQEADERPGQKVPGDRMTPNVAASPHEASHPPPARRQRTRSRSRRAGVRATRTS